MYYSRRCMLNDYYHILIISAIICFTSFSIYSKLQFGIRILVTCQSSTITAKDIILMCFQSFEFHLLLYVFYLYLQSLTTEKQHEKDSKRKLVAFVSDKFYLGSLFEIFLSDAASVASIIRQEINCVRSTVSCREQKQCIKTMKTRIFLDLMNFLFIFKIENVRGTLLHSIAIKVTSAADAAKKLREMLYNGEPLHLIIIDSNFNDYDWSIANETTLRFGFDGLIAVA